MEQGDSIITLLSADLSI